MDDLIGATALAKRLGFAHSQSLHTFRRRNPGFPDPVATLDGGAHIWLWGDVKAWCDTNGYPKAKR